MSAPALHKVALAASGLASLLQVIAVATVGWYCGVVSGFKTTIGLWKVCSHGICADWPVKAGKPSRDNYHSLKDDNIFNQGTITCYLSSKSTF